MDRANRPKEAEAAFERAFEAIDEVDLTVGINRRLVMSVYFWFSYFLTTTNRLERAVDLLSRALELNRLEEDAPRNVRWRAIAMRNLAQNFLKAGRITEAENASQEALEMSIEPRLRNSSLIWLGLTYQLTSRLPEAERAFRESLDIMERISVREPGVDAAKPTDNLIVLAHVLQLRNEFSEAEKYYIEAIKLARNH
jgi:tetratricopeptide (TPR) repeat protein